MSEAPKKMWVHEGFWTSGDAGYWAKDEQESEEETLYIRADIVDELVETTNALAKADFGSEGWNSSLDQLAFRIRTALAKMEESHEI